MKPSAIHYYYYETKIGADTYYFNIEENYVKEGNRHFFRLYSLTHKLRNDATLY